MFESDYPSGEKAGPEFDAAVEQLHADMAAVAGAWHAAAGQLVALAARALAGGLWSQSGVHSPEQWLSWQCGVSAGRARQIIAIARRADELPACLAALEMGEVSLDHAGVIARHVPAWAEAAVADLARFATLSQLSRVVRAYAFDPEPGTDPDAKVRRGVRFGTVDECQWRMIIETASDEGAAIEAALVAFRDRLFHARQPETTDPEGQRCDVSWLDAFNEMVEHALAHDGEVREHADRSRVLFHYDVDPAGHPLMHAHGQDPMPDSLRRLWTCDATAVPVTHRDGHPLNVGRARRIVPRRLRIFVERRDGGCRVPGCTQRRWMQIHHVTHWEDGGSTDSPNLVALCSKHHRLHHRGLLGVDGNADRPDGLTFTDQHGRVLTTRARPRPPSQPLDQAWTPPLGERIQYDCVWFGHPPRA